MSVYVSHPGKALPTGYEFVIRATLPHFTLLKQVDLIALAHGGKPMRDQDDYDVVAEVIYCFNNSLFGEVIGRF